MKHPTDVAFANLQRKLELILVNNKEISRDVRKLSVSIDQWSSDMRELVQVSFEELRRRIQHLEKRS